MKRMNFSLFGAASLLLVATPFVGGCDKDDDDGSADADDNEDEGDDSGDDSEGDEGDDGGACLGVDADAPSAEGDACTANADCNTGVCVLYQDVPAPEDAVCGPTPEGCAMRITATVKDFVTGEPLASQDVKIALALAAASDPSAAQAIVSGTSGADGRIDITTDSHIDDAAIGIVALVGEGDHYLTVTGVAEPEEASSYGPANGVHEFWALDTASMEAWTTALESDGDANPHLPLGERGGVVGIARDLETGAPAPNIEIVPATGTTQAIIRYLEPDGTFNAEATSETGLFVILAPGLAEKFVAHRDGMEVQDNEGTVGSAAGAVFTLVINVN